MTLELKESHDLTSWVRQGSTIAKCESLTVPVTQAMGMLVNSGEPFTDAVIIGCQ